MKNAIEIEREDYQDMIAVLKQACILIDNEYLLDPDWESQSKQTLFYEQARAVLAKVL